MERAVRMMKTGNFNPYFYDYPTLYLYVQTAVATARFLAGALTGLWSSLEQTIVADFYLWGRAVTALIGTATIVVTYRLARRFGLLAAFVAGLLLAVQPNHVRESHYVLVDVPMTFLVALTMLLAVRAYEQRTTAAFAWAGAAAGLAAATKSPGGVAILMPFVALAVTRDGPARLRTAAAILASAAGAFLLWAPYTILDLPAFLNGFGLLADAHAAGTPPSQPVWWLYLLHLRATLGVGGLALSLAAVAVALGAFFRTSGSARAIWAVGAVFVLAFSVVLSRRTIVDPRYLLPLIPPLFVLAGGTVAAMLQWSGGRRLGRRWRFAAAAAVIAVVAVTPAMRATGYVSMIVRTSSNALAYAWILENVTAGSRVALEVEGMILPDRYEALNVPSLIDHDYEYYESAGVEYLVTSSQAAGRAFDATSSTRGLAYRNLLRSMELLEIFSPSPEHPGSEIRVYRMLR
jgi:4-amino-4-deoxy-L-arabinose transferase-like glycosyltransferase